MSDNTFSKFFVITSQVMPEDLFCFEEVDFNSWKIRDGFVHQVHEVQNLEKLPSGLVGPDDVFVALCKGDGNGLFDHERQGMIATVHTDSLQMLFVRPSGDYIRIPVESLTGIHAQHPSEFGLEPYPVWNKPLKNDLTDTVSLR